jgi:glucosylceramidase
MESLDDAKRAEVMALLFDEADGIGFDWGRIPIGPSDYALDRYTLSSGPGEFAIGRDQMHLIPYVKAAQALKSDVKYWGSPWTPPPWAKTNGGGNDTENSGYDKGIFNSMYYQEYADFFVDWIQAYEAEGIPIDNVMPQNEPGWAQNYPTCAFGPARDSTSSTDHTNPVTLGTFVDTLFSTLDTAGLSTKVWFGTLSNNSFFGDYWNDMRSKASADRLVGVALQWETQASIGTVANASKSDGSKYLIMQSEHKCGNYPWGSTMGYVTHKTPQPENDIAPNDFDYGQESWDLMKSWIDDGVNIYSAWNMVLDTHGSNLDMVRVWNQNAMIVVDTGAGTYRATPYYYVFRHFAQYVDAAATRVGITGEAVAFQNTADNSVVAIVRTTGPGTQIVSIDGTLLQFEATGNGWATVNWKPE